MKGVLALLLVLSAAVWSAGVASASLGAPATGLAGVLDSDFNGDGYQDLVVGIPDRDVVVQGVTEDNAGAVEVWSGSATGLVRTKTWTKKSSGVRGAPVANQSWGVQTETGDFNGDGYSDLVVTPVVGHPDYNVLYGS